MFVCACACECMRGSVFALCVPRRQKCVGVRHMRWTVNGKFMSRKTHDLGRGSTRLFSFFRSKHIMVSGSLAMEWTFFFFSSETMKELWPKALLKLIIGYLRFIFFFYLLQANKCKAPLITGKDTLLQNKKYTYINKNNNFRYTYFWLNSKQTSKWQYSLDKYERKSSTRMFTTECKLELIDECAN